MATNVSWLRRGLKWYDYKLEKAPYITQMITNGPLWTIGDLLGQWTENLNRKKKRPIDWPRAFRSGVYGFFVAGPLFAWWYSYIEHRWMHLRLRGEWTKYLVAKIGCDQFLFEPIYLAQFFFTTGMLKGSSMKDVENIIEEEYINTFIIDTAVWPAAQAVNFRFVPARMQALYVNVVSLGWAGFLSVVSNQTYKQEATIEVPPRSAAALQAAVHSTQPLKPVR